MFSGKSLLIATLGVIAGLYIMDNFLSSSNGLNISTASSRSMAVTTTEYRA